jgi:hypothetical protein
VLAQAGLRMPWPAKPEHACDGQAERTYASELGECWLRLSVLTPANSGQVGSSRAGYAYASEAGHAQLQASYLLCWGSR